METLNTFPQSIEQGLTDEQHDIAMKMANGGCKDFAHYRFMCGEVYGLSRAMKVVESVAKRYLEADDE